MTRYNIEIIPRSGDSSLWAGGDLTVTSFRPIAGAYPIDCAWELLARYAEQWGQSHHFALRVAH